MSAYSRRSDVNSFLDEKNVFFSPLSISLSISLLFHIDFILFSFEVFGSDNKLLFPLSLAVKIGFIEENYRLVCENLKYF